MKLWAVEVVALQSCWEEWLVPRPLSVEAVVVRLSVEAVRLLVEVVRLLVEVVRLLVEVVWLSWEEVVAEEVMLSQSELLLKDLNLK